ncbi:MAG: hypothetical protein ABJB69_09205 [Spartobacteria bacterium]
MSKPLPFVLMNIARVTLIFAALIAISCSEKSVPGPNEKIKPSQEIAAQSSEAKEESELAPPEDEIAEDCVAFLRSTKTVPANPANADCPQCDANAEAKEVLKFDSIKVDRTKCSESTCEIDVTIRATFNPSPPGVIAGGLTGWISPERRAQYSHGQTPSGAQTYQVKVTYRRAATGWRAVEFN